MGTDGRGFSLSSLYKSHQEKVSENPPSSAPICPGQGGSHRLTELQAAEGPISVLLGPLVAAAGQVASERYRRHGKADLLLGPLLVVVVQLDRLQHRARISL